MDPDLGLQTVSDVVTDSSLTLTLTDGSTIQIETTCSLRVPDGEAITVEPDDR